MRIAAYTPALNEIKHVPRWAETTAGADYRLVADTGSTDGTQAALAAHGIVVAPITVRPWRFDMARNAALALLPQDIDVCLHLDMDEVVATDFFDVVRAHWDEFGPWDAGMVWINTGTWWRSPRLHARHGFHWIRPIHEVVVPFGSRETAPSTVNIDAAKIWHWPDDDKPRTNYLPMLEQACREEPGDSRMWTYLAREYWFVGNHDGVRDAGIKALEMQGWGPERGAICRWIASGTDDVRERRSWLWRATVEAPGENISWLALARELATTSTAEAAEAARQGLECPLLSHYLTDHSAPPELEMIVALDASDRHQFQDAAHHAVAAALSAGETAMSYHASRTLSSLMDVWTRPTASVIVPVWNAHKLAKRCIRQAEKTVKPDNLMGGDEIIVVDNGSTTPLELPVPRCTRVLLTEPDALGFAGACNRGADCATGEILVFLNSDTFTPKGWLAQLLLPFADPSVGAVGPRSNMVSGDQLAPGVNYKILGNPIQPPAADGEETVVPTFQSFVDMWHLQALCHMRTTTRLIGFCLAVRRDAFEAIGGFDAELGSMGGYEDDDLGNRLMAEGYKLVIADGAFVHHEGHASFDDSGVDWWAEQEKARVGYERKMTA